VCVDLAHSFESIFSHRLVSTVGQLSNLSDFFLLAMINPIGLDEVGHLIQTLSLTLGVLLIDPKLEQGPIGSLLLCSHWIDQLYKPLNLVFQNGIVLASLGAQ
jgi:hypothetical protein